MKRHRVQPRPKARRGRRAAWAWVAGLAAAAGAGAVWGPGLLPRAKAAWERSVRLPRFASVERLQLAGAPEALRPEMEAVIGWRPGDRWGLWKAAAVQAELLERFPCLQEVRRARSWLDRSVRFEAVMRRPVAAVALDGKPAGYLDSAGVWFTAPKGLIRPEGLPLVELNRLPDEKDLGPLSRLLAAARRPGAMPQDFRRVSYDPDLGGWIASLEDGTRLLWGRLKWTDQKILRLREVLADARGRFAAAPTADLRYFEDGKILVRPR